MGTRVKMYAQNDKNAHGAIPSCEYKPQQKYLYLCDELFTCTVSVKTISKTKHSYLLSINQESKNFNTKGKIQYPVSEIISNNNWKLLYRSRDFLRLVKSFIVSIIFS